MFTPYRIAFKVFRYSFSQTIPMFFNRLKSDFILVRFPQSILVKYRTLTIEKTEIKVEQRIFLTQSISHDINSYCVKNFKNCLSQFG